MNDFYTIMTRDLKVGNKTKLQLVDYVMLELDLVNMSYNLFRNEEVIGNLPYDSIMEKYFEKKQKLTGFISDIYPGETNEYKIKVSDMPKDELADYVLKEVNNEIVKQWVDFLEEQKNKEQPQIIKYRRTGCYRCKERINTETHHICSKCKGIKCDCGACLCDYYSKK